MKTLGYVALWATVSCFVTSAAFGSILPPNNLHLEKTTTTSGITEEEFNAAIDKVIAIYQPIIENEHDGVFVMNRLWTNNTVNASANQRSVGGETEWIVNMYGGLARRPEVTIDGFTLVICHELGHHLAGYFFYGGFLGGWAASEGQSDYFATQSCAREVWRNDLEDNAQFREFIEETPKNYCDAVWDTEADQNLCYRTMLASKSLADLLAALRGDTVDFATPDSNEVSRSNDRHPAAQCRLDTYVAGATCLMDFDPMTIPGKIDGQASNSEEAEEESNLVSCARIAEFDQGTRPRCWYRPLME